jgi:hypothetical protein
VVKRAGRRGKKAGSAQAALKSNVDIAEANARFDRLLDAMAKTPALPKKKRRVVVRQTPDEKFDD